MVSVLITGVTGQVGAILSKQLLEKKYDVYGTYRRLSTPNFWRLQYLGIFDRVKLLPADMTDVSSLQEALKVSQPDLIFNLAAQSHVGTSFEQPIHSGLVTGLGVTNLLEAVRHSDLSPKILQASSSEMYGAGLNEACDEESEFNPSSPYAAAKLYAYYMMRCYRDAYGMSCSNSICFNNESPLRGLEFVTRKISNAVARIALGMQDTLALGNINSKRDWGYSPDYADCMFRILKHRKPDDFVVATGETHSVKEFLEEAFGYFNMGWKDFVVIDKKYVRPLDVGFLLGDASKAKRLLGWKPKVTFKELVKIMVEADLKRWQAHLNGKSQHWDALNYDEDAMLSSKMKLERV